MLKTDHLPDSLQPLLARYWQQLQDGAGHHPSAQQLIELIESQPEFSRQLARVWASSDYAANVCIQYP